MVFFLLKSTRWGINESHNVMDIIVEQTSLQIGFAMFVILTIRDLIEHLFPIGQERLVVAKG